MLGLLTKLVSEVGDVPYSTRAFAFSFVVHRMSAEVLLGVTATEEITGATVSGFMVTVAVANLVLSA
jgi:hypothetical protein